MNPEKLNLWDRLFNRYRKRVSRRGAETITIYANGVPIPGSQHQREYVEYEVTDRLTGSVTIEKEYLPEP